MNNESVKGSIRLIATFILMVNMCLTLVGKNPIPFDETQVTEFLTMLATGLSTVWAWWKNNNMTAKARAAKELTSKIATGEVATVTVPKVTDDELPDGCSISLECGKEDE